MLSERTSSALTGISKATLQKGVRIKHLFRIMTHYPDLWMRAYANIYSNNGAITKGIDDNTLDGMSADRIENLIKLLINGQYTPRPVKRVYIPKKNGKQRPLGIPTGDDKLVQEVVRILLEQVYEPIFSDYSHGFRPERSCQTALTQVVKQWKGTKWIVDTDIKGFYDNINHRKMIDILKNKIDDQKFLHVIEMLLQAGYLENWKFNRTYTGTPQGGICSPILANIFLHELDQFMKTKAENFNCGKRRKRNPVYYAVQGRLLLRRKTLKHLEQDSSCKPDTLIKLKSEIYDLEKEMRSMPSNDVHDEGFKRLYYVRYADDFAIGLIGSKMDAEDIARSIEEFLKGELLLEKAPDKGGIHHLQDGFDFLGHHVSRSVENDRLRKKRCGTNKEGQNTYGTQRSLTSQIQLQVPLEKVWEFCRSKKYLRNGNTPTHRLDLIHLSGYEIVATINAEMRGFANFYALAPRRNLAILEWAGTSCLFRTLAHKHKTSSLEMRRKMKREDEHVLQYEVDGKQRILNVFKLKHAKRLEVGHANADVDKQPLVFPFNSRSELITRMNANRCEYCGQTNGYFEVHHIHKLKDLLKRHDLKPWESIMAQRKRKTMVLCTECHQQLHQGKLQGWKRDLHTRVESVVR